MTPPRSNPIRSLSTGVPGLDTVLGGGLPEYSFNLIAGGPGAGKTTLAQQIAFARASVEEPALYFTVLGEPPLKMLRHVQQFSFFDEEKFNRAVRFVNLSAEAMEHDLEKLLGRIVSEVEAVQPGLVIVDSFRTVAHQSASEAQLQGFVQRLALHLTGWQATTFLVGEYEPLESQNNPIFTIADGILWLSQTIERSACVRRLEVTKLRGQSPMPGLHTLVTTSDGLRIFPRILPRGEARVSRAAGPRASTGVPGLDGMMSGGIPAGESALFVGPSGSGKSAFARHFIAAGAAAGEPGVLAVFEQHPGNYVARAEAFGPPLADLIERGSVETVDLRPLESDGGRGARGRARDRRADEGATPRDRFALRLRTRARPFAPRRLPPIALPAGHGAHGSRRHGPHDGGARAVVHRRRALCSSHRLPGRRAGAAALRRARREAGEGPRRREDAEQPARHRHPAVRDRRLGHRDGRPHEGLSRRAQGGADRHSRTQEKAPDVVRTTRLLRCLGSPGQGRVADEARASNDATVWRE